MDHEKKFELLKELLDAIVDDCNMEGTVQHVNAVTAIDNLHREVNRASFIKKENHGEGTM